MWKLWDLSLFVVKKKFCIVIPNWILLLILSEMKIFENENALLMLYE